MFRAEVIIVNKKFKQITAGVMALACFAVIGGVMVPTTASAGAIKHRTYSTTPSTKKDVSYLEKHTTFSKDEIAQMLAKGFVKTDIENLYMIRSFANKDTSFDEIMDAYRKAGRNVETVLEELNIDGKEFHEAFDRTFPEDDSEFGRVQRIKNLRNMKF